MALSIRSNLTSLRSLNHLTRTDTALSRVLEQLSSGKRINSIGDDPTGLIVATRLETETIAARQAIRNSNDGISIVQTSDAANSEVQDLLQRMRELAVEGSSSSLTAAERTELNDEYIDLRSEISRIAVATEFNDISLSDGSTTAISVQVGINSGASNQISIDLGNLATGGIGLATTTDILTTATASTAIDTVDSALDTVSGYRADLGSTQQRLDSAVDFNTALTETLASAESNVLDVDIAFATSESTRLSLLGDAGVAALAQANNINKTIVSKLLFA